MSADTHSALKHGLLSTRQECVEILKEMVEGQKVRWHKDTLLGLTILESGVDGENSCDTPHYEMPPSISALATVRRAEIDAEISDIY